MKTILGLFLILTGLILGLYVGVWWAFIGGIVAIIEQIKAVDTDSMVIAISVVKVIFAVPIAGLSAMVAFIPGVTILGS